MIVSFYLFFFILPLIFNSTIFKENLENRKLYFSLGNRRAVIKIDINDDNFIEPYEFFTVNIVAGGIYNSVNPTKIIYIEDNDCN